jgi:beta-1,4-N-acetylglucosaminyltransferase
MILTVHLQADGGKTNEHAHFLQIYRSREVGQSYITSISTTLVATLHAMWIVIRIRPQVVCTLFILLCTF